MWNAFWASQLSAVSTEIQPGYWLQCFAGATIKYFISSANNQTRNTVGKKGVGSHVWSLLLRWRLRRSLTFVLRGSMVHRSEQLFVLFWGSTFLLFEKYQTPQKQNQMGRHSFRSGYFMPISRKSTEKLRMKNSPQIKIPSVYKLFETELKYIVKLRFRVVIFIKKLFLTH